MSKPYSFQYNAETGHQDILYNGNPCTWCGTYDIAELFVEAANIGFKQGIADMLEKAEQAPSERSQTAHE